MSLKNFSNLFGTLAASFQISKNGPCIVPGTTDPNGVVSGNPGDLYVQSGSNPQLYQNVRPTTWRLMATNFFKRTKVTSTTYYIQQDDYYLGIQTTGRTSLYLPAGIDTMNLVIKDELGDADTNIITIYANGSQTIDGNSTLVIDHAYGSVNIVFGDEWHVW